MKPTRRVYLASLLGGVVVLCTVITQARPRPPLPPWPEDSDRLGGWGFDDPTNFSAGALLVLNASSVESWSGYALEVSGKGPALFAVPQVTTGKTNYVAQTGTFRWWFAPAFGSVSEGSQGPGAEAVLIAIGAWSEGSAQSWWSLTVTPDGNAIGFGADLGGELVEVLKAAIAWRAGAWHQIALTW